MSEPKINDSLLGKRVRATTIHQDIVEGILEEVRGGTFAPTVGYVREDSGDRATCVCWTPVSPAKPNRAARPQTLRYLPFESAARKTMPMAAGVLDYFPDALAAVAEVSWLGNEKHNPGEPLHHSRGKSMDHPDCIMRHLTERGGFDVVMVNGVEYRARHSASLAWRALALLQEELESEFGLTMPRGARFDKEESK
jgi:hypothetical protein